MTIERAFIRILFQATALEVGPDEVAHVFREYRMKVMCRNWPEEDEVVMLASACALCPFFKSGNQGLYTSLHPLRRVND